LVRYNKYILCSTDTNWSLNTQKKKQIIQQADVQDTHNTTQFLTV